MRDGRERAPRGESVRLTGTDNRVLEALRQRGKMSNWDLREAIGSKGSGVSDALRKLLPLGLARHAGKGPHGAALYEATPDAEVEAAAAKYAARKPKRRRRSSAASKLGELRQVEPGKFGDWHRVRKRVLELTPLLTAVDKMAFWEAAPLDELELVLAEVVDLREWADDVIGAIAARQMDANTRTKIDKMLSNMSGRTPAEVEAARSRAAVLRDRL